MPSITYSELFAGEATTAVEFNGHTIDLTYDPSSITDDAFREIKRMAQQTMAMSDEPTVSGEGEGDGGEIREALAVLDDVLSLADTVNALLCRFLVRWSLDERPGVMFPITAERLGGLPLPFRQAVLTALMSAGNLGETNGTTSSAPSRASSRTATAAGSRR